MCGGTALEIVSWSSVLRSYRVANAMCLDLCCPDRNTQTPGRDYEKRTRSAATLAPHSHRNCHPKRFPSRSSSAVARKQFHLRSVTSSVTLFSRLCCRSSSAAYYEAQSTSENTSMLQAKRDLRVVNSVSQASELRKGFFTIWWRCNAHVTWG